MKRAAETSID
jgi:hypothetical protein